MSVEAPVPVLASLSIPATPVEALPLLGQSAGLKRVLHLAQKVAPTDSAVLITGETGTGKELLARAIHAASRRAQGPFVAVNAGAIPESLQESELFGHRKGAFTGANADRKGLFEEAGGGTLFLDEIGDTSPALQVRLLRVLQTGSVRRLGEGAERPVDVRVIAATNRLLDQMVARNEFREDLFFRLNVVHLHLPPLRERGEDLELLLKANLARFSERLHKDVRSFAPEAWEALRHYFYPASWRTSSTTACSWPTGPNWACPICRPTSMRAWPCPRRPRPPLRPGRLARRPPPWRSPARPGSGPPIRPGRGPRSRPRAWTWATAS